MCQPILWVQRSQMTMTTAAMVRGKMIQKAQQMQVRRCFFLRWRASHESACLSSWLDEGEAMVGCVPASSSRWTATEKRRQKAGSLMRAIGMSRWKERGC